MTFKEDMQVQRGAFETIFSGIKLLIEKGINFGVITTITKYNVDYLNEIVDFYYKSDIKSVLLNPIEPNNINALNTR